MTPMLGPAGFGWQEMLIILAIVLILFGGSRLAGLGKSTGRALREFKDETRGMLGNDKDKTDESVETETTSEPATGELVDRPEQHTTPQTHHVSQNVNGQNVNGQSTPVRRDA